MSYYAGLDVSMKQTFIAIVDIKGRIVFETSCETEPEAIATTLKESGYELEKIGLESGCLSFWLIDELSKYSVSAVCMEARRMATMIALKINKTDKNDAREIANALRCDLYNQVYHKSKKAIDIGLQMGVRSTLVKTRTMLKNSLRGYLKAYGVRFGAIVHDKFPDAIREAIQTCETGVQRAIEGLLNSYENICANIKKADKELEKLCVDDPVIALFEGIPGVGKITALTYKAIIDDPYRFENARDLGAYLGLTPRQYSSGETVCQGRISKCGSVELRTLLVDCAMVLLTRFSQWTKLKAWGLRIMKRSGIKKAATAVARKLAIIMLRMWQEGKEYIWGEDPSKKVAVV